MSVSKGDGSDEDSDDGWMPYSGPRGGVGWRRVSDGEVNYDDEPPGEMMAGAEELMEFDWDELIEVGIAAFGDSFAAIEDAPEVEQGNADDLRRTMIDISSKEQMLDVLQASDTLADPDQTLNDGDESEEGEEDSEPESDYEDSYDPEKGDTDFQEMGWVQRAFDDSREFDIGHDELEQEWNEFNFSADVGATDLHKAKEFVESLWERDVDPKAVWDVVGRDVRHPMVESAMLEPVKENADLDATIEVQGQKVEVDFADRQSSKYSIEKVNKAFSETNPDAAETLNIDGEGDPLQESLDVWSASPLSEDCDVLWAYMREETGYDNIPLDNEDLDPEDIDPETLEEQYGESVLDDFGEYVEFHREIISEVFGDSIPVFRGGGRSHSRDWTRDVRGEESAEFEHMTGASWSFDPMVAREFMDDHGGSMWLQNVSPDEIFGSTLTGTGFNRESEFIVSGGDPEYDIVDSPEEMGDETCLTAHTFEDGDEGESDLFALAWERLKQIEDKMQGKSVE